MRGKCLYSLSVGYPPCSLLEHFVEGAFLVLFVFAFFVLNFISFLIRQLFCSAFAKGVMQGSFYFVEVSFLLEQ